MRHPMYNQLDINLIHPFFKSMDTQNNYDRCIHNVASKMGLSDLDPETVNSFTTRAYIMKQISEEGHTLIKISKNEWSSDITKSTLEKLKIEDLKLPFDSGAIQIDDDVIYFAYVSKERQHKEKMLDSVHKEEVIRDVFKISYFDKTTMITYYLIIGVNETISDVTIADEIITDLTITTLSALLYIASFKDDTERVSIKKIIGKKSGKLKIPKHVTNIIKLTQVAKSYDGRSTDENKQKSDKRWIVRGHWRNQFYKTTDSYKLKWIDPYWKGSGSEEINKVYKLGK